MCLLYEIGWNYAEQMRWTNHQMRFPLVLSKVIFLLEFINKSHDLNFYILSSNYEIILSALKGLQYKKGDRSGERFWGLMQELCGGDAEDFFGNCLVYTYCPLAFYGAGGKDVSLSKLKVKINDCNNKFQWYLLLMQITFLPQKIFSSNKSINFRRFARNIWRRWSICLHPNGLFPLAAGLSNELRNSSKRIPLAVMFVGRACSIQVQMQQIMPTGMKKPDNGSSKLM